VCLFAAAMVLLSFTNFIIFFGSVSNAQSLLSLFDLNRDPFEENSVYDDPNFAGIQSELEIKFAQYINISFEEDVEPSPDKTILKAAGGFVPWLDDDDIFLSQKEAISNNIIAPSAPNLILMLLDDVGLNDVDLYGGSTWLPGATPNMDNLAIEGIVLTEHYTAWVCGPTRASLLTGKYAYRLGYSRMPEAGIVLGLSERTLAQELSGLGYRTAMIGKHHLGSRSPAYLQDLLVTIRNFRHLAILIFKTKTFSRQMKLRNRSTSQPYFNQKLEMSSLITV
jgi:hypothetical protein